MWKWLKCLFTGHDYLLMNTVYVHPFLKFRGDVTEAVLRRLMAGSTESYYTCQKCGKEKLVIRNGDWRNR